MNRTTFIRLSFFAAVLGGLIWTVGVLILALRLPTISGEELAGLLLGCLILFMLPPAGHALLSASRGPRILASGGALLSVVGALVVIATLVRWGFDQPEQVWSVVYASFIAMCAGYALTGLDVARSATLRWPGLYLAASALPVPFANTFTQEVWLWLPLGLAWMVYGLVRLAATTRAPAPTAT